MKEVKCPDCGTANPKFAVRCQFCKKELPRKGSGTAAVKTEKEKGMADSAEEIGNGGEETKELPPHVVQFVLTCPGCMERKLIYNNTNRLFECGVCNARYALMRMQSNG